MRILLVPLCPIGFGEGERLKVVSQKDFFNELMLKIRIIWDVDSAVFVHSPMVATVIMSGMNLWRLDQERFTSQTEFLCSRRCQVVVLLALSWREPSMGHQWCLGIVEPMLLLLSGL